MAGDYLVKLHLVAPMSVEPQPDKSVFGRFDRVLRSVGAPREVMVRPRMITAVAETRYKTGGGLPVSVVGLHGKDELLVVGPAWALEDLANGRSTSELKEVRSTLDVLLDVRQYVLEEIYWLSRVPELMELATGVPVAKRNVIEELLRTNFDGSFMKDPAWEVIAREVSSAPPLDRDMAVSLLRAIFRTHEDVVFSYFQSADVGDFVATYLSKAAEHYARTVNTIAEGGDPHPAWWLAWDKEGGTQDSESHRYFLTPEGRNITSYPVAGEVKLMVPKPRRYSMHRRWRNDTRARREQEAAEGSEGEQVTPEQ